MNQEHEAARYFKCYRRPFLNPNELAVAVCRADEGDYNLDELQSEWRNAFASSSQQPPNVRLELEFKEGWSSSRDSVPVIWMQLCSFVRQASPELRAFGATFDPKIEDQEWALMLELLPRHLSELCITTENGNPVAYQQIGRCLPKLENLVVYHGDGCPLAVARKILPQVVCHLPVLKRLTLWNLPVTNQGISWKSLVCAIQSREDLEEVNVFQGYTPQGRAINPLSDEELDAIQYCPRLNEAKRKHVPAGAVVPSRVEDFVEMVLAVHDRIDCLHYFFLQVDPNLYANAAVANLSQ